MAVPVTTLSIVGVVALIGSFGEAVRRRNVPAMVNAGGAIAVTLLPSALALIASTPVTPSQTVVPLLTLWLSVAGVLHTLGMLGLYESLWWWDHLTHTLSSALVAAMLYAGFLATGSECSFQVGAVTVLFTLAIGVLWELVELLARDVAAQFDIEPVLVHYGWRDTGLDLLFDVVGAGAIVGLEVRVFLPLVEEFPTVTRRVLAWSGGAVVVASVLTAAGLAITRWMHLTR